MTEELQQVTTEQDARGVPYIASMGRKVGPSEELLKKTLIRKIAAVQAAANDSGEEIIIKTTYLSTDKNDIVFRQGMREQRREKKEAGHKQVLIDLDPTQQAMVCAVGYSKKLATAVNNILMGQLACGGYVPPAAEEVGKNAELPSGATKHTHKGALLELWMLEDGSLDGLVRLGSGRGQRLSTLSFAALIGLWHLAQSNDDRRNVAYVEAYLEASVGPDWADRANPENQAQAAIAEHYEVLGITAATPFEEAKSAYRQALHQAHPDHGGKNWQLRAVQSAWAIVKGIEEARLEAEREAAEAARKAAKL